LEQLEPESSVYNICRASRLLGNLNAPALEASLNEIISRHETLRTAFRLVDGRPVQVVEPARDISIEIADLRSMPTEERDAAIQQGIKAEAERRFDLFAGQLLRCTLLRVNDQVHVLILMTYHSASDAWSMGILTRELWTLYEAFSNGKPSPLELLPVQYSDYAVWQRDWVRGEVLDAQLAYWKKRLENLSVLNLPTDRPRTPRQSFRGARVPITLPPVLTESVNELSSRYALTPFMTLLAAFQVLLFRYTGQDDIVIGSPIANRRRPEIEGLIGFFVNTLVLRADLSGNPSFRELLSWVKVTCVAADANQDLPFEKLVQELQPERDLSHNPLFQVMFVLQNATNPFRGIPGLRVEPIEIETSHSPFDLSLFLRERDGNYIGYIEYSTDLFNCDRIERLAGHFQKLLEGIVGDPDQPISRLPILNEQERHQILVEWNDTDAGYPQDQCIHELFEAQVERTPDAIALEFEDQQVTYRDLNRRANQLAHYLMSLGIGPEKLVGICVERSIELVVALLGILKAGGAYVPLDPTYPEERLRFMLEDSQVSVLLTQEKLVEERRWKAVLSPSAALRINSVEGMKDGDPQSSILDRQVRIVYLDRDLPKTEHQSDENPTTHIDSHNLAYVIYTSGSTGKPKGVQIEHRSVVNCLCSIDREIDLSQRDAWLAVTTISFDIAALELYLPLTRGARIIVANKDESIDPVQLSARLKSSRATVIQATPSLWKPLVELGSESKSGIKILCGGEALSRQLADQLLDHSSSIWNLYGPTESTIWSTVAKVAAEERPISIGRPIANTLIYILDAHLQPVPIGIPGDLYIGGDGLARGYLNRPELTSEKFVTNPFNNNPHSRLYRTGDRAKYLADGNVEFLGRDDNQVKIRGHRVELEEIENILNRHPGVKESVIVARDRAPSGEKHLVAYVVLDKALVADLNDVRRFLTTKLPAFMIPNILMTLDALPLMPNGKIDRSKLPSPDESPRGLNAVPIPPRSELVELVANIWRDVLQIETISVHDNFFALGGHSLLAIQIVSRLQEAFNKEVPLRILFDAPTIAELGQELETIIRDGHAPELPPIVRAPRDGALPLSMNQEHLWHLDQMMPGMHFYNMPYVYRLSGELNVEALEKALKEIIRRHEALRTVFEEIEGQPVQIIKDGSDFQLQTIDLRGGSPGDASRAAAEQIVEERWAPFDLVTGPLRRMKLLCLTEKDALLLITMHHIISDHWSMQVFRGELIELYRAIVEGCPSSLPESKIQFGDYALWERQLLNSGQFNDRAKYWKDQVMTDPGESQSRVATENDSGIVHEFHRQTIDINASLLSKIKHFAVQQNCTPFTVVLSAVFVMSYLIFGEPEILCGTLMSNRRSRESEGTIGHFVNTVVIRARLSSADTFEQVLKQVRMASLAAYANQEYPFEQLRRNFEKENKSGRDSSIRVLFNYQKRAFSPICVAGLVFASYPLPISAVESESLPAAYDLIFDVKEMSTGLIGTVNVVNDICKQSGARNANIGLQEILNIMVSDLSKSLLDVWTITD
jgi:amino acid adenylation domain-containing protein